MWNTIGLRLYGASGAVVLAWLLAFGLAACSDEPASRYSDAAARGPDASAASGRGANWVNVLHAGQGGGPDGVAGDGSLGPFVEAGSDASGESLAPPPKDAGPIERPIDEGLPRYPCRVALPRVLVLYGGAIPATHDFAINARRQLGYHRIWYEEHSIDDAIEYLAEGPDGRFAAILISDYEAYRGLAASKREALDTYARSCDVGMYFLSVPAYSELNGGEVTASASFSLTDMHVEPASPVLDLTRDGGVVSTVPGTGRTFTQTAATGYRAVAWATSDVEAPSVLADLGQYDGVRRVFNGHDFAAHFLHELLLIDSLSWLSPVDLHELRERYFGVDIDDLFQPNWNDDPALRTVKIQAEDVPALIESQQRISAAIGSEFRYAVGFNMGFYHEQHGDPALYDDIAGDDALVAHRSEFYWFDHFQYHTVVTHQTERELEDIMMAGHTWAEQTGVIDYTGQYAVTPQHSGISDEYTPLYQAWNRIWNIHFSSDRSGAGSGFEYMDVRVSPRYDIEIWAAQSGLDEVSMSSLLGRARGGGVYRGIVARPVSIYMTHQANYARDHLGMIVFDEVAAFFARWTRYEIKSGRPEALVEKHFEFHPLDCPAQPEEWTYPDTDADGFGNASWPHAPSCPERSGFVSDSSDCDDGSATVYPDAEELCNAYDDDCDGMLDEGLDGCVPAP